MLSNSQVLEIFKAIAKRLLEIIVTLIGASILIWSLLPLAPGDPAHRILIAQGITEPTDWEIEAKRQELGLDRPYIQQYLIWLNGIVHLDFSDSYQNGKPVLDELSKRLPVTIRLATLALVMAIAASILLALISAGLHQQWPDRAILFLTQIGASTPSFLVGILALQYIVVELGLGKVLSQGETRLILLPAICLAFNRASSWAQLLRAGLLEQMGAKYAMVATARGARKIRVMLKYALPNALLPFLTVIGLGIGGIIGGSAIIEAIFTWPGIGSYVFNAIGARDFPVVQGFVIIAGTSFVAASTLVDIVGILLDPRIRQGAAV